MIHKLSDFPRVFNDPALKRLQREYAPGLTVERLDVEVTFDPNLSANAYYDIGKKLLAIKGPSPQDDQNFERALRAHFSHLVHEYTHHLQMIAMANMDEDLPNSKQAAILLEEVRDIVYILLSNLNKRFYYINRKERQAHLEQIYHLEQTGKPRDQAAATVLTTGSNWHKPSAYQLVLNLLHGRKPSNRLVLSLILRTMYEEVPKFQATLTDMTKANRRAIQLAILKAIGPRIVSGFTIPITHLRLKEFIKSKKSPKEFGAEISPTEKKGWLLLTLATILATMATTLILVKLAKRLKLGTRLKLLLDRLREKGWVPGRRLNTAQRKELELALKKMPKKEKKKIAALAQKIADHTK